MLICITRPVTVEVTFDGAEPEARLLQPGDYLNVELLKRDVAATRFRDVRANAVLTVPDNAWRPWRRVFEVKDAVKVTGYSDTTIRKLYDDGKLDGYDVGGVRIHGDSLARMMWRSDKTLLPAEQGEGPAPVGKQEPALQPTRSKIGPGSRLPVKRHGSRVVLSPPPRSG